MDHDILPEASITISLDQLVEVQAALTLGLCCFVDVEKARRAADHFQQGGQCLPREVVPMMPAEHTLESIQNAMLWIETWRLQLMDQPHTEVPR